MSCIARFLACAAFGLLQALAVGPAAAAPIGATGADAYGYRGNDIAYNLRNIRSTGTYLGLGDDQLSSAIGIGFTFNFYGRNYSNAYVSSNGFLTFGAGESNGCCTGAIDSPWSPNNLIAGWWEDLDPTDGGSIRYQTRGQAGSREFVVGFYKIQHWPFWYPVTFEMILHEGSNHIEFQWAVGHSDGGIHTVGIENANGSIGLPILSTDRRLRQQGYCVGRGGCGPSGNGIWNDEEDDDILAFAGTILSEPESSALPELQSAAVPEPGTLALLGLGLAVLTARRRRKL